MTLVKRRPQPKLDESLTEDDSDMAWPSTKETAKRTANHIARLGVFGDATKKITCLRCKRTMRGDQYYPAGYSQTRQTVIYYSPICKTCRKQQRSEFLKHKMYSPYLHRVIDKIHTQSSGGARSRKIAWILMPEDLMDLYLRQTGVCAITGIKLSLKSGVGHARNFRRLSLDRISSEGNYTRDNVQFVCWAVNRMKGDFTVDEFRFWAAQVAIGLTEMEDDDG